MLCKKVSTLLSEFFDGVLDAGMSVRIAQHLKQCENCQRELNRLSTLHGRLSSIEKIQAPDYLHHLVQVRLENKSRNTWNRWFKDALAFRWSRIRTTEGRFYWTRALGTLMTAFFFYVISSGIDLFTGYTIPMTGQSIISREYRQEFNVTVGKKFGRFPKENFTKIDPTVPAMDHQYYHYLGDLVGESFSTSIENEGISLLATVDSSGTATIENVLEYPEDLDLLQNLSTVITSARYRPASINGRPVSSPFIFILNKISVYD
jgi:hypothetical protein